ncbi:MAG: hypothetical protein V6Z81_01750 [Parvularculales bacterium]
MTLKPEDFSRIYEMFGSAISRRHDCGQFCAPLNGGTPVCCDTGNAIPVVDKAEWHLLKSRTDLWRRFKPFDAASREVVDDLASVCRAIECKGAAFCERENRSLACRAFPFFPYFTKQKELVGLSYYWTFADRCWVMSNLHIVEPRFVRELITAYEYMFARDDDERDAFINQSVSIRRIFSRRRKSFPVIGREGEWFQVPPHSGGQLKPITSSRYKAHAPFTSQSTYRAAIREAGGNPDTSPALPPREALP